MDFVLKWSILSFSYVRCGALKRAAAKQNAFHVEPLQIRGDHGMKNSNQEAFRTKLNMLRERTPGNFVISVDIVNT